MAIKPEKENSEFNGFSSLGEKEGDSKNKPQDLQESLLEKIKRDLAVKKDKEDKENKEFKKPGEKVKKRPGIFGFTKSNLPKKDKKEEGIFKNDLIRKDKIKKMISKVGHSKSGMWGKERKDFFEKRFGKQSASASRTYYRKDRIKKIYKDIGKEHYRAKTSKAKSHLRKELKTMEHIFGGEVKLK